MKLKLFVAAIAAFLLGLSLNAQGIYDFKVKDMEGKEVSLSDYQGKVLLIVNTATKCGFTPQYEELQALYEKYKDKGLVILDFPCNQFGGQAPGDIASIHEFCTSKYNTTFPQFDKVDVNGDDQSPLFAFLKSKQAFKGFGNGQQAKFMDEMLKKQDPDYASKPDIKWNFTKFLVDSKGEVVARFEPTVSMNFVSTVVSSKLY
ncbi:MAG: glutathione peroxidase [Bacteroidales bacterium]|nr:glutathione peroxidase [Bacteroidales bacterium]